MESGFGVLASLGVNSNPWLWETRDLMFLSCALGFDSQHRLVAVRMLRDDVWEAPGLGGPLVEVTTVSGRRGSCDVGHRPSSSDRISSHSMLLRNPKPYKGYYGVPLTPSTHTRTRPTPTHAPTHVLTYTSAPTKTDWKRPYSFVLSLRLRVPLLLAPPLPALLEHPRDLLPGAPTRPQRLQVGGLLSFIISSAIFQFLFNRWLYLCSLSGFSL